MINTILSKLKFFDSKLSASINIFLKPYMPPGDPQSLTALLPNSIKIVIYSLIILVPLLFFKFLYPENKKITVAIVIILGLLGLSIIITFFGLYIIFFMVPV